MELRTPPSTSPSLPRQLVVFAVARSRWAFPLAAVERVLSMVAVQPVPGAPRVVLGAINRSGQVVPVVDLRRRFDLPLCDYGLSARLLIVGTRRRTLAVAADDVIGVIAVDPAGLAPAAAVAGLVPPGIDGIAALPDGLLFIHDLEALLLPTEEHDLGQALERRRA
jgi:purine-binding chemotaxis protein CheW